MFVKAATYVYAIGTAFDGVTLLVLHLTVWRNTPAV